MFLEVSRQEKRYGLRFFRLQANKKGMPDVLISSTARKKVPLTFLVNKMPEDGTNVQISFWDNIQQKR